MNCNVYLAFDSNKLDVSSSFLLAESSHVSSYWLRLVTCPPKSSHVSS